MSRRLVLVLVSCCGCQLADVDVGKTDRLWQAGQAAMDAGKPDEAIALYQRSLAENAQRSHNHLSLAAAYIEKGADGEACAHLAKFLEANPTHKNARFYYAELLLRRKCLLEAHHEFERSVADGQDDIEPDLTQLIHCHARLVEIAEGLEDEYQAHLHRGIGMFLLAQARRQLDDAGGELPVQALLCKAAGELSQAHVQRLEEARPCFYLHAAWRQLAQQQLARRWLHEAEAAAPFSYLTPAEQTRLQLASRAASAWAR